MRMNDYMYVDIRSSNMWRSLCFYIYWLCCIRVILMHSAKSIKRVLKGHMSTARNFCKMLIKPHKLYLSILTGHPGQLSCKVLFTTILVSDRKFCSSVIEKGTSFALFHFSHPTIVISFRNNSCCISLS
jgi:hypothetical protein